MAEYPLSVCPRPDLITFLMHRGDFVKKDQNYPASAAIARNSTKMVRLPDKASIFRALHAISLAIDFIRHSRFIVFSDSKSSLEALNAFRIELDLVLKIIKDYTSLIKAGKVIRYG